MNEQDRTREYDKEDIVFTSGGTKVVKIIGIISLLIGIGITYAAFMRMGDLAENPVPGYLMGSLWAVAGVGIFFYRSEKRFNPISQRWKVLKTLWWFKSKREGTFEDLSEVEVDCDYSSDGASYYSGPYTYTVKVKVKNGNELIIQKDLRFAHQAFSIANKLSGKLSLPLRNRAAGKDNIIEMIPPDDAPEPSGRLSTSTFDGDTVTFLIPSGSKLKKNYRISMIFIFAFIAMLILGISLFAFSVFWSWFTGWLRSSKVNELRNALITIPFIILPLIAVYVIFTRVFMVREKLQASPTGITYRKMYGSWSQEKRIPKGQITAVKTRLNKFGRTPWIEDIMVFAGPDTILVAQGLPDEEKIWIASQLSRILRIQQYGEK